MASSAPQYHRIRDLGYSPGILPTGPKNSILDVPGVHIGQVTKEDGYKVRSGVTVILPRAPEDIDIPCYAGMHTLNGNGEVTGGFQIKDWGYTNTPLALTNSTSLGLVYQGIWAWILSRAKQLHKTSLQLGRDYGTPVVGETADWWLNDVYLSTLSSSHVEEALAIATRGSGQEAILEGQHGGGAGMTCHEFLGGTGTSSRLVNGETDDAGGFVEGKYTVGVLCQSNYGHKKDMRIGGVPIGQLLLKEDTEAAKAKDKPAEEQKPEGGRVGDGSIVIIIITDVPMLPHQLVRLAQRASIGLAQVGSHGTARNHSGDIFLALSTANKLSSYTAPFNAASSAASSSSQPQPQPQGQPATFSSSSSSTSTSASHSASSAHSTPHSQPQPQHFEQYRSIGPGMANRVVETNALQAVKNECVDAVFRAASEAVEEAVLNSVCAGAGEGPGRGGRRTADGEKWIEGFPGERVRRLLERWLVVV